MLEMAEVSSPQSPTLCFFGNPTKLENSHGCFSILIEEMFLWLFLKQAKIATTTAPAFCFL